MNHRKDPGRRRELLEATLCFVRTVRQISGVRSISLLGSITTDREDPKDVDLLIVIADATDLSALARVARRLKGMVQQVNRGADVFLADEHGNYLGRTCHWRDCRPGVRAACHALHCGRRPHLNDDLGVLRLSQSVVAAPPVTVWPSLVRRCQLPADVELALSRLDARLNNALEPSAGR